MAGFPEDFVWGAATAAYQIEGAVDADGRGPSIWDRFSHTPGTTVDGHTGDVACDHYHRWREDIGLMAELGLDAYRFSIAWPRVIPKGRGEVNRAGLDFYDRLIDGLLEAGIEPYPTLYHWDLPQALEDEGGWPSRATAEAFGEYAAVVADRIGDRVVKWMTLNEPWVSATNGYELGVHAPGRHSPADALDAGHHLLVGHGLAVQALRAAVPGADVGIVLNLEPKHPATADAADRRQSDVAHALMNRWYLDPILGRGYPPEGVRATHWEQTVVRNGDLDTIATPIDHLGVNYYTRQIVDEAAEHRGGRRLAQRSDRVTDMGWEVYPPGIAEVLEWLHAEYAIETLFVTENGAAYHDRGTTFDDADRVAFLRDHLVEVAGAIERGVPVAGYFVWSLMDNFEWAWGYTQRFGITHVDFETQQRTPRASARWYSRLIAGGTIPPADA